MNIAVHQRFDPVGDPLRGFAKLSDRRLPISPGTLADSVSRFVPLFEPVADAILAHQNEAALRHADETGWRACSGA